MSFKMLQISLNAKFDKAKQEKTFAKIMHLITWTSHTAAILLKIPLARGQTYFIYFFA